MTCALPQVSRATSKRGEAAWAGTEGSSSAYLRENAPADARGICDRLRSQFGEANLFMDIDQLLAGQRFDRELEKALASCEVLIAVIGTPSG